MKEIKKHRDGFSFPSGYDICTNAQKQEDENSKQDLIQKRKVT